MLIIREHSGGCTIECRVSPRAGRSAIKGVRNGILQVALAAPPVEGRANKALIELLSEELGIPKSRFSILTGEKGRTKVVLIQGIDKATLLKVIPQS